MLNKLKHIFSDQFREPLPDFLRGVAILFMIQVHLTELLLIDKPEYQMYIKISYFLGGIPAAPVFITFMGYFLDRSKASIKKEIKHGFGLIGLGLLLNILLNLSLIYRYIQKEIDVNILHYLFGVDILIFAGFSYLILSILKRIIKRNILFLLMIIFIYMLQYFLQNIQLESEEGRYLLSIFYRNVEWSYFPLIPWLAFPLFGMYLRRTVLLKKFIDKKLSSGVAALYVILSIILINYGVSKSQDLNSYYNHNLFFFFYSVFILAGLIKFLTTFYFKFSENLLVNYIRWLGKNVTIVYIFQWIIIGNIATYLYKALFIQDILIIFLLIMFSISICTYLYNFSRI